jgi:hypothetical protein
MFRVRAKFDPLTKNLSLGQAHSVRVGSEIGQEQTKREYTSFTPHAFVFQESCPEREREKLGLELYSDVISLSREPGNIYTARPNFANVNGSNRDVLAPRLWRI